MSEDMKGPDDIHSCDFGCQRIACVLRQRDGLWAAVKPIYNAMQRRTYLEAAGKMQEKLTFSETMAKVANIIEQGTI